MKQFCAFKLFLFGEKGADPDSCESRHASPKQPRLCGVRGSKADNTAEG
jgi:hypothetical protein